MYNCKSVWPAFPTSDELTKTWVVDSIAFINQGYVLGVYDVILVTSVSISFFPILKFPVSSVLNPSPDEV